MWTHEYLMETLKNAIKKGERYIATTLGAINRHHKNKIAHIVSSISGNFKEDLYLYYYGIKEIPKCACGKNFKFSGFNLGYSKQICNVNCFTTIEKKKNSTQITWDSKYGGHPMKTEETKNKLKKSILKKYGEENFTKYSIKKGTYVSNFSRNDVKEKTRKVFAEKYGCHPMQTIEVMEKQRASSKLFYDYILPSGKKVRLQGYEGRALDELLKKYKEEDILTSAKDINQKIGFINYEYKGVKRKYYPDFYIISENKIVEVKSSWTYKANKKQNELKRQACVEKGLSFEFIIN